MSSIRQSSINNPEAPIVAAPAAGAAALDVAKTGSGSSSLFTKNAVDSKLITTVTPRKKANFLIRIPVPRKKQAVCIHTQIPPKDV